MNYTSILTESTGGGPLPNRLRHVAQEHVFQVWGSGTDPAAPLGASLGSAVHTQALCIASDGNVGIGTTRPLATLHVMGDVTITSTGALTIPRGTTPEQPSDPVAGMIRYNDTEGYIETYEPSFEQWVPIGIFLGVLATGGDEENIIIDSIQYRVHTFTINGQFNVLRGGEVEYLIVAGGGSGGVDNGGGAGAGGLLMGILQVHTQTDPNIVVGGGGPRGFGKGTVSAPDDGPGFNGQNSHALGLTAIGGSGGTGWVNTTLPSGSSTYSGGSGAGQSCSTTGVNSRGFGIGTEGQGKNGGAAIAAYAGGGGGAGEQGQSGNSISGGAGGLGISLSISGTSTYYAGGGTGGWDVASNRLISGTAASNNGVQKKGNEQSDEFPCAPNTGHGGHGSNHNNRFSGAGGSGIVIIRYRIG